MPPALTATVMANDAARKGTHRCGRGGKAELAKAEPNFERLLNMREEFPAELSANGRKAAVSGGVGLHPDVLNAEQKALVKSQLLGSRVPCAENLRENFGSVTGLATLGRRRMSRG